MKFAFIPTYSAVRSIIVAKGTCAYCGGSLDDDGWCAKGCR